MLPDQPSRYRAFISYRHADKAWGDWLHKALESYRVPRGVPAEGVGPDRRLGRIFRDREELAAAHDLGTEIQGALNASANLIVICSPGAAHSHWVSEEIKYWKHLGRADRVFAIIVEGEPNAADPARECFPPALKFEVVDGRVTDTPAEPIAADARDAGDGRENAKLKLIAGLLNVGFDSLRRRELEAQRRRFRRFAAVAAALVIVFAGLAAAAGWFAWQSEVQRTEAERQRAEAVSQRERAEANLKAGIDTAQAFISGLTEDLKSAAGAQKSFLLKMQQRALALLDALSTGQALPEAGDDAKGNGLYELGWSLLDAGDTGGAMKAGEEALGILERLAKGRPDDESYKTVLPLVHELIGKVRLEWDDSAGAIAEFDTAIALREAQKAPDETVVAEPIADAAVFKARALLSAGDPKAAEALLEQSIAMYVELRNEAAYDSVSAGLRVKAALTHADLAEALLTEGRADEARTTSNQALTEAQRLKDEYPEDSYGVEAEAVIQLRLGEADLASKDFEDADIALGAAQHNLEERDAADPSVYSRKFLLAEVYAQVAALFVGMGQPDKAPEWAAKARAVLEAMVAHDPLNKRWAKALAQTGTVAAP